jgi:pentatricopeptide repeat protein
MLLEEMRAAAVVPNVQSMNAAISACGAGGEWARALALLAEMCEGGPQLAPDVVSLT